VHCRGAGSDELRVRSRVSDIQKIQSRVSPQSPPESAIYLYFVPCQWFMPLSSEIRLSWCWCYAACFAQKTPRGH
jgi:hypothetical protein